MFQDASCRQCRHCQCCIKMANIYASTSASSTFGWILKCRKGERVKHADVLCFCLRTCPGASYSNCCNLASHTKRSMACWNIKARWNLASSSGKTGNVHVLTCALILGWYIYRYIYRDGMAYVWKLVRLIRHQLYVQIRRSGARCALLISDPSF